MFEAMAAAGEVPAAASAEAVVGDALALPYDDGTFDVVIASEILEHVPARRRGHRRVGPGAQSRWHAGGHRAALAAGTHLLAAVGRVPRQRGRPRPDLQGQRSARQDRRPGYAVHPYAFRPRPALTVLVAEMRCRSGGNQASGGHRLPQDAGVGHDAAPAADPRHRGRARSADRQERRAVLREAADSGEQPDSGIRRQIAVV